MGIPVSELLTRMPGREFAAYLHFNMAEPWGLADRALQSLAARHADADTPEAIEAAFDRWAA